MMKDNNQDWVKSILHTEDMPKGYEVKPEKTIWNKKELLEQLNSDRYDVVNLRLNNACLVFNANSQGFTNITCTMMLMAFSDDKNQKVIYGNCLLTNKNYIK